MQIRIIYGVLIIFIREYIIIKMFEEYEKRVLQGFVK